MKPVNIMQQQIRIRKAIRRADAWDELTDSVRDAQARDIAAANSYRVRTALANLLEAVEAELENS